MVEVLMRMDDDRCWGKEQKDKWLKEQGFDVEKPIYRQIASKLFSYRYSQEDPIEEPKDLLDAVSEKISGEPDIEEANISEDIDPVTEEETVEEVVEKVIEEVKVEKPVAKKTSKKAVKKSGPKKD